VCFTYTMNSRQKDRLIKIAQILETIKKCNGEYDKKEFLMQIMSNQQVSQRKAKEYLMIAEYEYQRH